MIVMTMVIMKLKIEAEVTLVLMIVSLFRNDITIARFISITVTLFLVTFVFLCQYCRRLRSLPALEDLQPKADGDKKLGGLWCFASGLSSFMGVEGFVAI